MENPHQQLTELIGQDAIDELTARNLIKLQPLLPPDNTHFPHIPNTHNALIGARIGIRLAQIAHLHGRHNVVTPSLLQHTAPTTPPTPDAHERQLDISFQYWTQRQPNTPAKIAQALKAITPQAPGVGSSLRHIINIDTTTPWYQNGHPSYGYGAITRTIGVTAALDHNAPAAAMADMAITHAHPTATWTAATVSKIIQIVSGPQQHIGRQIAALVAQLGSTPIHKFIQRDQQLTVSQTAQHAYQGPTCESLLPIAIAAALTKEHPTIAISQLAADGAPTAIVATAAAVLIARHGTHDLPNCWVTPTQQPLITPNTTSDRISVLIDRSGSMKQIRDAVEIGFDQFIAEQQQGDTPTDITVIQFDDQNPHDIILNNSPLAVTPSLKGKIKPRGLTPLYDAIAQLLDNAEADDRPGHKQLVVIVTDGQENASRHNTQTSIFKRIKRLERQGWTFVYLGANQDSYTTGRNINIANGNVSNFEHTEYGVNRAYTGLSRATRQWREKDHVTRQNDRQDFWGGIKEAEDVL